MANYENYKNKNGANDDNIDNQQELKLEEKKDYWVNIKKNKIALVLVVFSVFELIFNNNVLFFTKIIEILKNLQILI